MKISMYLWKRENGVYYIVWRDRDGRQRMRSTRTKDKQLARKIFNRFKREWLAGKILELDQGSRISLKEFMKEYLEWVENSRSSETYRQQRYILKKVLKIWGNVPLNQIKGKHGDDLIVSLKREGQSPATINKIVRHLRAAFSKAMEWDYLKANPFKKGVVVQEDKELPRFLSKDEIRRLLQAIDDEVQALCGIRPLFRA